MGDKELLYQIINREISNLIGSFNPAFRIFTPSVTKYIMAALDDYIDAFIGISNRAGEEAASEFIKDEMNKKIESFIAKFEQERGRNDL